MHTLTLTVANEQDYHLLLLLARRLGLTLQEPQLDASAPAAATAAATDVSQLSREELLAIIARGGDGLSIPDPVAWQREQRQDRPLPFRA